MLQSDLDKPSYTGDVAPRSASDRGGKMAIRDFLPAFWTTPKTTLPEADLRVKAAAREAALAALLRPDGGLDAEALGRRSAELRRELKEARTPLVSVAEHIYADDGQRARRTALLASDWEAQEARLAVLDDERQLLRLALERAVAQRREAERGEQVRQQAARAEMGLNEADVDQLLRLVGQVDTAFAALQGAAQEVRRRLQSNQSAATLQSSAGHKDSLAQALAGAEAALAALDEALVRARVAAADRARAGLQEVVGADLPVAAPSSAGPAAEEAQAPGAGAGAPESLDPELAAIGRDVASTIALSVGPEAPLVGRLGQQARDRVESRLNDYIWQQARGGQDVDPNALVQLVMRNGYDLVSNQVRDFALRMHYFTRLQQDIKEELNRARRVLAAQAPARGAGEGDAAWKLSSPYRTRKFRTAYPGSGADVALDELGEEIEDGAKLQQYVTRLEDMLGSVGDDAQLAQLTMQTMVQRQQQMLQMVSNWSKAMHESAMSILRKIGA